MKNPTNKNEVYYPESEVFDLIAWQWADLITNENIETVIEMLGEHADLNAEFSNTSPEDANAHTNGLCIKLLKSGSIYQNTKTDFNKFLKLRTSKSHGK